MSKYPVCWNTTRLLYAADEVFLTETEWKVPGKDFTLELKLKTDKAKDVLAPCLSEGSGRNAAHICSSVLGVLDGRRCKKSLACKVMGLLCTDREWMAELDGKQFCMIDKDCVTALHHVSRRAGSCKSVSDDDEQMSRQTLVWTIQVDHRHLGGLHSCWDYCCHVCRPIMLQSAVA